MALVASMTRTSATPNQTIDPNGVIHVPVTLEGTFYLALVCIGTTKVEPDPYFESYYFIVDTGRVDVNLVLAKKVNALILWGMGMFFKSWLTCSCYISLIVPQMLLDVVSVFNMVSSNSQTAQSAVLNLKGVEVRLPCRLHFFVGLKKSLLSLWIQQFILFTGDELKYPNMDTFSSSEDLSGPTNNRIHATDASTNQLVVINNEMEDIDSEDENQKGTPDTP
ncbi:hypothetical protein IFM89_009397 [Coptis chinensis]|uniref:Uncharacterized protein n=1 Tax=Coptis chinensis TaxID=261450 RepID=A0A835LDF1_9MAGN|nr:hypothetical protein IFM89_009397 [Coptis chinensis]